MKRLAVALSIALASAAQADVRPIEVTRAGWQRLALDGDALGRGVRQRWSLRDPGGAGIAASLLALPRGSVDARTRSVEEVPGGWRIVLDFGPTPFRHERLELEPARRVAAPGCTLEASDDGIAFTALARGDLFRLGDQPALTRSALDHPITSARYLRLTWPARAGFPEIVRASTQALPAEPLVVPVGLEPAERSTTRAALHLGLPGAALAPSSLTLAGDFGPAAHPTTYRLFRPDAARWELLRLGQLPATGPATIDLGGEMLGAAALRLELYQDPAVSSRVSEASASVDPLWLLFEAARPGTYELAYGAIEPEPVAPTGHSDDVGPVTEVQAGPARPPYLAPMPRPWGEPVALAAAPELDRRWRLRVEGAQPGDIARVTLPLEVLDAVDHEPARLRVLQGDRDVPYAVDASPQPELAVELRGLVAELAGDGGHYRVRVPAGSLPRPTSQVELFTWDATPGSTATLLLRRAVRPGVDERPTTMLAAWACSDSWPASCRAELGRLPQSGELELEIAFARARPAPAVALDVRAWRPVLALLFVVPVGELVLAAGGDAVVRDPQLAARLATLAALPSHAVRVVEGAGETARSRVPARLLLLLALGLAGVALLWVLARNLRP